MCCVSGSQGAVHMILIIGLLFDVAAFAVTKKALLSLPGWCFRRFDCVILGVLSYADKKEV